MNFYDIIEQFEITEIFNSIKNNPFDFIENIFISLFFMLSFYWLISKNQWSAFYVYSKILNSFLKQFYHTKFNSNLYSLPCSIFLYVIMIFVLWQNVIGMVPETFTITALISLPAHLSVTFFFASFFIALKQNKFKSICGFLPNGVPANIAWILFLIEFISYFMRTFSLAIRLFINILAGHLLLKIFSIIVLFLITFLNEITILVIFFKLLVIAFILLEYAACLLQAIVISALIAIYLNQAFNFSH